MYVKARCAKCRAQLDEFNSKIPPERISCPSCGTTTSGKEILTKISERIRGNADKMRGG